MEAVFFSHMRWTLLGRGPAVWHTFSNNDHPHGQSPITTTAPAHLKSFLFFLVYLFLTCWFFVWFQSLSDSSFNPWHPLCPTAWKRIPVIKKRFHTSISDRYPTVGKINYFLVWDSFVLPKGKGKSVLEFPMHHLPASPHHQPEVEYTTDHWRQS